MTKQATSRLEKDLLANYRRFLNYNQQKLELIRSQLSPRRRRALTMAPYLLHFNPKLNSGPLTASPINAPAGICFLKKPPKLTEMFREMLPEGQPPDKDTLWGSKAEGLPIKAFFLMGSTGSIAQTPRSDFDFWVIFDKRELSRSALNTLERKCQVISRWIKKIGRTDSTFFLMDLEDVRANRFGSTEGESAGTALAGLLKEEFYRSLTLLGGQAPWWWVVPPGWDEAAYHRAVKAGDSFEKLPGRLFIDLGRLPRIKVGEFFGASLWELHKSLNSPFKSAMKISLLEVYADNPSPEALVAERLKRQVFAGRKSLPDPYLIMYDQISDHMTSADRTGDLDIIRICLYLKADTGLTAEEFGDRKNLTGRKKAIAEYVAQWGWRSELIDSLGSYQTWSLGKRLALTDQINKIVIGAYSRLVNRLRDRTAGQLAIDPADMTALGRRLMLFYGRAADRVAFLPNLLETYQPVATVSLTPLGRAKGASATVWEAVDGAIHKAADEDRLLRTIGLPHLLAWLAVNELAAPGTAFYLNIPPGLNRQYQITVPHIQRLFGALYELFGQLRAVRPTREELITEARVTKVLLIPNLETGGWEDGLKSLSLVYQTSWGELYCLEPDGLTPAMAKARELLTPTDGLLAHAPEMWLFLPKTKAAAEIRSRITKVLSGLVTSVNLIGE